ncbi:MAG TPA: class I SAM-dependent methyltransferase [Hyphomicrobium sp.]|nr:class I SAM-dependent methyltransferase [Hyphomicrobium sp.]
MDHSPAASAAAQMDAIYRYQRYVYDATRKYYLLGRDRLIAELAPPAQGRVLEIACGTGRNLIAAARRYPDAHFYGFDISAAMLETARGSIARAGLEGRIAVAAADATDFSGVQLFGVDKFDRIFISYALSMIPPWQEALQQALDVLAPGGRLLIVDFGEQARLPLWFKRGLRAWLSRFSVTPRDGLSAELDRIAAMPGYRVRHAQPHRGYAVYAVIMKDAAR